MTNKIRSLSCREREMMDIIFRAGKATASEVMEAMTNRPSYSAVRATLRVLEQKGLLRHEDDGTRYVYRPTLNRDKARQSALDHVMATFFDGSRERAHFQGREGGPRCRRGASSPFTSSREWRFALS